MSNQSPYSWLSCGLTTIGTVRKHNEDAYLTLPDKGLWVVADGMGGHNKGDIASQTIIDAYTDFEPLRTLSQTVDDLENRVLKVNDMLREGVEDDPRNIMGSTVAMMYAYQKYAFFLWAGDSRIYRYRDEHLIQISHDHSFVQESVDKGAMLPEEAAVHPSSNIITRAVGVHEDLFVDIDYCEAKLGDKYLICSDGLFKDVTLNHIADKMNDIPFKAAEGLIKMALANQANDNVTVIVIECKKPAAPR